jgi:hypothetical protein
MTELRIIPWIRDLGEVEAVGLARTLIYAEAGRLGLPLDEFSMSGRVKAKDQGIDGRTHFPEGIQSLYPTGHRVWQVKSGPSEPDANKEFDEVRHPALFEKIRDGYDYVLFWTNDPVVVKADNVKSAFTAAMQSIREDAKATFIFGDQIERLCYANIAVLAQNPLSPFPFGPAVTTVAWAAHEGFKTSYQLDALRATYIDVLRAHLTYEESATSVLHLYGDTGVGKSRLVFEALNTTGVSERALVFLEPNDVSRELLAWVANSPEHRLVLVVDDCTAADRRKISDLAGLAQGRIRLITIGARYRRDLQPSDGRYLELLPLEVTASTEIAKSLGLSDEDADNVAHYTEGYPKLAYEFASAVQHGGPNSNLIDRIRGEALGSVLESMLGHGEDSRLLGVLSLFERLGYDQDLSRETQIACEALGIDEFAFREVVDREHGRFVSSAGRFRLVTPRLFAVWLATEFIRETADLAQSLKLLPDVLRERVISQMKEFAGDRHVQGALRNLLGDSPLLAGALDDVDGGSAELIRVTAIIDPPLAMEIVGRIVGSNSVSELRQHLTSGRRALVNALELLLWFDDLFDDAADALLKLAIAENEQWSNNATGVLQGLFRVLLGGTSAPYERRIAWARRKLADQPAVAAILIPALGTAFDAHEMRTTPDFGSRIAPEEWRPSSFEDDRAARLSAWRLLIDLAVQGESGVAKEISGGLWAAVRLGFVDYVLADIPRVSWSPEERSDIASSLERILRNEDLPDETRSSLSDLHSYLEGRGLGDRVTFLLSQDSWELIEFEDGRSGLRPIVRELASEIVSGGDNVIIDAARKSSHGKFQTGVILFEHISEIQRDPELLRKVEAIKPTAESAIVGTLVGMSKIASYWWTLEALRNWLDHPNLARLVIRTVHALPASDELAALALEAVEIGASAPSELGTFLYGAWTKGVSSAVVSDLSRRVGASNEPRDLEAALGMLSYWLDENDHPDFGFLELASMLIDEAAKYVGSGHTMLDFYRQSVLRRIDMPSEERLQKVQKLLTEVSNGWLSDADLDALDDIARELPNEAIAMVFRVILGTDSVAPSPNGLWLNHSKLLSRLTTATSPDEVADAVRQLPVERWRELVAHVSFKLDRPNSVIETLVSADADDVTRARAAFSFMYPDDAWFGSEADYLRSRLPVAESWKNQAMEPATKRWLDELILELGTRIEQVEQREQEERW